MRTSPSRPPPPAKFAPPFRKNTWDGEAVFELSHPVTGEVIASAVITGAGTYCVAAPPGTYHAAIAGDLAEFVDFGDSDEVEVASESSAMVSASVYKCSGVSDFGELNVPSGFPTTGVVRVAATPSASTSVRSFPSPTHPSRTTASLPKFYPPSRS